MNEFRPVKRADAPVPVPPLVGYVPHDRIEEVGAWLLALRLTSEGTWDCLIGWVRTSGALNGHQEMHAQEIGWVPAARVRKLPAYRAVYDQVPRLRESG